MKPIRKLYYNLTITAVSVIVAVVVGGLEVLNLIGDQLGLTDGAASGARSARSMTISASSGIFIVGIFLFSWLVSFLISSQGI